MTNIIKNSAIIAGVIAVIAYAIYRYASKRTPSKPISYEDILSKAIAKVNASTTNHESYDLVIFPPSKATEFISQNPDFFDDLSLSKIAGKELVIWFIQCENDVMYHEALISDSFSKDFTDAVPMDKVYKKIIKVKQ
ncbi:MAG: hypothetical protein K2K97_04135 [Muribaculaceae bacterium]|nr:hypothetical protein [Muribaculaceae bacterium]